MKHTPTRTCIVCREKDAKRGLTRLVRTADAGVVIDATGKRAGRGAYVCERQSCWHALLEGRLLDRALKTTVSEAEREAIRKRMYGREDTNPDGH